MADAGKSPEILVVDDDEGLLVLLTAILRGDGYNVTAVGSGMQALEWLETHTPDLMLLDLKMKDIGGPALLKRINKTEAPVPFVVVTGQGDERVAVEMMKNGALDYVMKSTGLLELLPNVVRRAFTTVERDRALARTRAELRESEARFAAAAQATNDGVWELQLPEGKGYFSNRWKAILGYGPDELPDEFSEWLKRIHHDDWKRFDQAYRSLLDGEMTTFRFEHRLRHKNGTYRWVLSRALLVRDPEGRPLRLTGALTDITERKDLEKEVLRVTEREQSRIGQDLHDGLGQQLTAIELMCQSLKSDIQSIRPDLAGQVDRMCEFLREATAQTRSLAHGLTPFLLDASGLQAALAHLVERTNSMGQVKCRFKCPTPVTLDDSDAALHLYRIAQEALNNALKHARAREIVVTLSAAGNGTLIVKVSDNGRGLPSARRSDAGLGLQVMKHRAEAIGGELTIASVKGEGTTVTCILTRKDEKAD